MFLILQDGTGEHILEEGVLRSDWRFYLAFTDDLKQQLVKHIREFFRSNPRVPDRYRFVGRYSADGEEETHPDNSKIRVAAEMGMNERIYPYVILSNVTGRIRDLWLGNKQGDIFLQVQNPQPGQPAQLHVGERIGGFVDFTVTMEVGTLSTVERSQVLDLLIYALVGPVRKALGKKDLNWMPDAASLGGQSEEDLSNLGKIYKQTISVGIQGQWYDDFLFEGVTVDQLYGTSTPVAGVP